MMRRNIPKKDTPMTPGFSPDKALEEMIETVTSLRDLYKHETEALIASDTKAFLSLQDTKLLIARRYQHGVETMNKNYELMKRANPRLKDKLKSMHGDFSSLAQRNMEALERMQRNTQRLGDTIMEAARDAARQQRTFAYGGNGAISGSTVRKGVSMGVSETA
jgi:hypothetical protein